MSIIGAYVNSSWFCGVLGAFPSFIKSKVSQSTFAPSTVILSWSSPAVISSSKANSLCKITSPVSSPSSINIVDTPVFSSPFIITQLIGAAPLYFGNNETCTFIQPCFGISKNSFDNICPYATTTITSGFNSFISFTKDSSFAFIGWYTGKLFSIATCLTGENTIFLPLPTCLSGCVTTPIISYFLSISSCIHPLAISGVPINNIFK